MQIYNFTEFQAWPLQLTAKQHHNKEKLPMTLIQKSDNRRKGGGGGGVGSLPPPKSWSEIKVFPSFSMKKNVFDVCFPLQGIYIKEMRPRRVRRAPFPHAIKQTRCFGNSFLDIGEERVGCNSRRTLET